MKNATDSTVMTSPEYRQFNVFLNQIKAGAHERAVTEADEVGAQNGNEPQVSAELPERVGPAQIQLYDKIARFEGKSS